MPTPLKPLPLAAARWTARARALRVADALLAWVVLWGALTGSGLGVARGTAILAAVLLIVGVYIPPVRVRWRPVSAAIGFIMSQPLRAGDRAWYIHGGVATLVLVTARHGARLVIARPNGDAVEGMSVRRTRVLLIPAERGQVS
jgi:hypothetical protein